MHKFPEGMLDRLVATYGSPLYVYQLEDVGLRVAELRHKVAPSARYFYSLKANPLPSLVAEAVRCGCSLEVTSENELAVAIGSGIDPANILYSGPGKTPAEIALAFDNKVSHFSAESWNDLFRIDLAAKARAQTAHILLRINPDHALGGGLAMSGAATQFGFELNDLMHHWERIQALGQHTEIIGFHVFYGTQMKGDSVLIESFRAALADIESLCAAKQFEPRVIDLGGGFPWPYASTMDDTPPLPDINSAMSALLSSRQWSLAAEVWFESGRYISASSGNLVATVLDIKQSKDETRFVVLDAGINHLGGMSGLGRIPRGFNLTLNHQRETSDTLQQAVVVGPLCSPLDCMNRKSALPIDLAPGELLVVPNVGAYGVTASLVAFLTRQPPCEIALKAGEVQSIHQLRAGHQTVSH